MSLNNSSVTYYADYYPFGSVMQEGNAAERGKYGYQGDFAERDPETGLNHFELREYDPIVGRWLSVDPYRQHHSPYMSMSNSPIMSIDPDGGFDRWNLNTKTGEKTWINDDGGSETQYIHFDGSKNHFIVAESQLPTVIQPTSEELVSICIKGVLLLRIKVQKGVQKTSWIIC